MDQFYNCTALIPADLVFRHGRSNLSRSIKQMVNTALNNCTEQGKAVEEGIVNSACSPCI